MRPLRIGILGAARITELALLSPARALGAEVVMVAARHRPRAEEFAAAHGIPTVVDSYQDLLASDEIEAVYNPLPNSLHGPWNRAAIEAGKHVLSEKPSASDAEDALDTLRAVENAAGPQFFEGFHYRYHPVVARLHEVVASGEIGRVVRIESVMDMPAPDAGDPRWSRALAGGATMDLGCYSLHSQRILGPLLGGEPEVESARAGERPGSPGVDEWLTAQLRFPDGAVGVASCNMGAVDWRMSHRVIGEHGEAVLPEFVRLHLDNRLLVTTEHGTRTEHVDDRSSYTHQLEAFTTAVRTGTPSATDAIDALATMQLIDAAYRAAGLETRPRS